MNVSDVTIHVNERLDSQARSSLEEDMRQVDGVIAPRFSPGHEHLMIVAFNPDRVQASVLLHRVQASGYRAQLVNA